MQKTYEELWNIADKCLKKHNQTSAPIDIDKIIESEGLNLHPVSYLKRNTGNSGALAGDLSIIYYDLHEEERHPRRIRFTLAHEFAHFLLHHELVRGMNLTSQQSWKEHVKRLYKDSYDMEKEADRLAAFILIPSNLLCKAQDTNENYNLHNVFEVSDSCMSYRLDTQRFTKI